MEFVLDPGFEHFLIADSGFDGVSGGAPFLTPSGNEWDVVGSSGVAASLVEWSWRPK